MNMVSFFGRSCKCSRWVFETSDGVGSRGSEKDWPRAFWYWQGGWPGDLDMVPESADSWQQAQLAWGQCLHYAVGSVTQQNFAYRSQSKPRCSSVLFLKPVLDMRMVWIFVRRLVILICLGFFSISMWIAFKRQAI